MSGRCRDRGGNGGKVCQPHTCAKGAALRPIALLHSEHKRTRTLVGWLNKNALVCGPEQRVEHGACRNTREHFATFQENRWCPPQAERAN